MLFLAGCVSSAFGGECSNSTPIQSPSPTYREKAVFTAPVRPALDPPGNSGRFSWEVGLINSNYVNVSARWMIGEKMVRVYAARGASYKVQLFGYSNHPDAYNNCVSDPIPLTVQPGMEGVYLRVPASRQ
jgi:hypothetical protein